MNNSSIAYLPDAETEKLISGPEIALDDLPDFVKLRGRIRLHFSTKAG
jgi:hypothetical protein